MSTEQIFVGIDVSKARLDIAVRPNGKEWSEANGDSGIAEIVGSCSLEEAVEEKYDSLP